VRSLAYLAVSRERERGDTFGAIGFECDSYQVTTHKESGIVNAPNLWCDEHDNPRYILDLIKRIVTLSLETRRIIKTLPKLTL